MIITRDRSTRTTYCSRTWIQRCCPHETKRPFNEYVMPSNLPLGRLRCALPILDRIRDTDSTSLLFHPTHVLALPSRQLFAFRFGCPAYHDLNSLCFRIFGMHHVPLTWRSLSNLTAVSSDGFTTHCFKAFPHQFPHQAGTGPGREEIACRARLLLHQFFQFALTSAIHFPWHLHPGQVWDDAQCEGGRAASKPDRP